MTELQWGAAFLVAALSTARLVRLAAFDHYPPARWVRDRWDRWTGNSEWNLLGHCAYCLAPWVGLGVLLWGYLTDFNQVWWWVNGWLAVAYVAAIVVSYDGDD
jgi:hypothetical protein